MGLVFISGMGFLSLSLTGFNTGFKIVLSFDLETGFTLFGSAYLFLPFSSTEKFSKQELSNSSCFFFSLFSQHIPKYFLIVSSSSISLVAIC